MSKTFFTSESQGRDTAEMCPLLFKMVPINLAWQGSQEREEISGNSRKSPKHFRPRGVQMKGQGRSGAASEG